MMRHASKPAQVAPAVQARLFCSSCVALFDGPFDAHIKTLNHEICLVSGAAGTVDHDSKHAFQRNKRMMETITLRMPNLYTELSLDRAEPPSRRGAFVECCLAMNSNELNTMTAFIDAWSKIEDVAEQHQQLATITTVMNSAAARCSHNSRSARTLVRI